MKSRYIKYSLLLCLGLLMMQPVFAQDDVCTNTNRGDSTRDIDADNDGLIEICYLEDLNAIRYQLDGSGYKISASAARITNGCAEGGAAVCIGYELMRDLDFEADDSYVNAATNKAAWTVDNFETTGDVGWDPIGTFSAPNRRDCSVPDNNNCFSGIFEGNGNRISNLQINRDSASYVGLFAGNSGSIRNISLAQPEVEGEANTGALVGLSRGIATRQATIINSNAVGVGVDSQVKGSNDNIGGLVGINGANAIILNSYASVNVEGDVWTGGLVGTNDGKITNSYATGNVAGKGTGRTLGGLVGQTGRPGSAAAIIENCYALGDVSSDGGHADIRVGGLVGFAFRKSNISNSYAIGNVEVSGDTAASNTIGGLIGNESNQQSGDNVSIVENSYWNSVTSGQTMSRGDGEGKTTAELQAPIMATGIYEDWSASDWDFGTMQTYPVLRYNEIAGVDACDSDPDTALPRCGTFLPGQTGHNSGLSILFFRAGDIELNIAEVFADSPFFSQIFNYDIIIPAATFQIEPYAINDAVSISIMKDGDNTNYFASKSSGDTSDDIMLATDGTANTIKVVVADASPTTYTFTISTEVPFSITDAGGSEVGIVDEGEEITLTAAFGDSGVLKYSWEQAELKTGTVASSVPTLTLRIPEDFITNNNIDTQDIVFTLRAMDATTTLTSVKILRIMKVNNGEPSFTPTVTTSTISIAAGDDPDGTGSVSYAWERRGIDDASWQEISGATMNTYSVPSQAAVTTYYRVRIRHTDAQGYILNEILGPFRTDIDDDDNGLIDIYYLEDLDNVRHQTDGSGYTTEDAAKITLGCPADTCDGYELRRDLDFATTQSYLNVENKVAWTVDDFDMSADTGWNPIGSYSGIFEGNGNRIFNLRINRDAGDLGLFSGNSGSIRNIGLSALEIEGGARSGGLVGSNEGTIMNSNVSGQFRMRGINVGGLVGLNRTVSAIIINSYARGSLSNGNNNNTGGLIGHNEGRIINSYAAVDTSDSGEQEGGLVGNMHRGSVVNSYATGKISASSSIAGAGGLLGGMGEDGQVINSYSIGAVRRSSGTHIGGLIGRSDGSTTNSYWDTNTSGQTSSAGGTGRTTDQLRSRTMATGIYAKWSTADWDFGTAQTYPVLRHTKVDGVDACDSDPDTALPRCGTLLSGQSGRDSGLSALFFKIGNIELNTDEVLGNQPFSSLIFDYDISIPVTALKLEPHAVNDASSISIMKEGDNTNYFARKSSGDTTDDIMLATGGTATILRVIVADAKPTTYTFTIRSEVPVSITNANGSEVDKVNEGEEITLTAAGFRDIGNYMYSWQQPELGIIPEANTSSTLTLRIAEDFIDDSDTTMQRITFVLNANDGSSIFMTTKILPVIKVNNGVPIFTPIVTTSTVSIAIEEDPDGEGSISYVWERRSQGAPNWQVISGFTGNTYSFPSQDTGNTRYRVRVSYTDAQGYVFSETSDPFPIGSVMIRAKIFLEGPLR